MATEPCRASREVIVPGERGKKDQSFVIHCTQPKGHNGDHAVAWRWPKDD